MSPLRAMAFSEPYLMNAPLRGVNLGGWLVLEPWLTPKLFASGNATDEYTYCKQGKAAIHALRKHRDTFITEQDFRWLAEHDVQAVRLPIGHWVFGETAPYDETVSYVDKAFMWAAKHGLQVLLDLHGAPQSQNGTKHSGRAGKIEWDPDATLRVLERIAERYGNHSALLGISLLNEPSPHLGRSALKAFYDQAYRQLRPLCKAGVWLVFSDAFRPFWWRRAFQASKYPGMVIDYHHYQIYTWLDKRLSARLQLLRARYNLAYKVRRMSKHHPAIIGEWSLALPSKTAITPEQRAAYFAAQHASYRRATAWFYWTYKTPYGGAWSYRHCVEQGLIA